MYLQEKWSGISIATLPQSYEDYNFSPASLKHGKLSNFSTSSSSSSCIDDFSTASLKQVQKSSLSTPSSSRSYVERNFSTELQKSSISSPSSSRSHIGHNFGRGSFKQARHSNISTPSPSGSYKENNFTPVSLKRSYSECISSPDSDSPDRKRNRNSSNKKTRWSSALDLKSNYSRNSYPSVDVSHRYQRKSLPFELSPKESPTSARAYNDRCCIADQTPYANDESDYPKRKQQRLILPRYKAWELLKLKSDDGFIDTHCHLDFLFQRQNFAGTYQEYREKHPDTFPDCYKGCVAVFCNPFTFDKRSMWQKYLDEKNVWAAFGCHPHNAKDYNEAVEMSLKSALEHPKVRALGEIGLDYSNRNNCMKETQHKVLKRQLKIAKRRNLPLVIHCREAHLDCMEIMTKVIPKEYKIHLHCFTDTLEWANKWLALFPNLFIGITNVVTFPSATDVHEVARNIPLNRLLLETDAPYFVPRMIPKGKRWSHPGMAIHVAAQIAALRGCNVQEVLHSARENTRKMYDL